MPSPPNPTPSPDPSGDGGWGFSIRTGPGDLVELPPDLTYGPASPVGPGISPGQWAAILARWDVPWNQPEWFVRPDDEPDTPHVVPAG